MSKRIGTLGEKSLHAALKASLATPGDRLEAPLGGYVVDVVRGNVCIEIQTGNFSGARRKLNALLETNPVRLVYPIAAERYILRLNTDGEIISRRKSPKRGTIYEIFKELVSLAELIKHPRFGLDVVFTHEEQVWRDDGKGSWRRKHWSIVDHRLIAITESHSFETPADFATLLPDDLPPKFMTSHIAAGLKIPRPLAGKMAYCLRSMGAIEVVVRGIGKGKPYLYKRFDSG
jgi:hypothetical protein